MFLLQLCPYITMLRRRSSRMTLTWLLPTNEIGWYLVVSTRASIRYHCLAYFQLIIGYGYQCVPFIAITLAIKVVCSIWCRPVFLTRLKIPNPHECTGRIAFVCAFHCGILFDAIDSAHEISVNETWAHIIHLFTSTARIWAHDMCSDFVDPIPSIAFVILFYPIAIFPAFTVEYIFWIIITIWYLCQGPCKIKVSIMALQLMTMIRVVRYCAKFEMGFFIHHSNEGDFTRGDARCNLHCDCQILRYVGQVRQLLRRWLYEMRE